MPREPGVITCILQVTYSHSCRCRWCPIEKEGGELNAKNQPVPVVRRQSRRSDEFLCCDLQEFKGRERQSIWRGRAGTEGDGHFRDIRARRTEIPGAKRRPAIHLFAGHLVLRELRDAAGSRRAVREAF